MAVRRVGIWYNDGKDGCLEVTNRLCRAVENEGGQCVMDERLARALGRSEDFCSAFQSADFLAVVGGDGTILSALDVALPADLPLLGVNMGRMGYLSEIQPENIEQDIRLLMAGAYTIEERMLLCARAGETSALALNDVAFNRSATAVGILSLEISSGGVVVDRFSGDGLVVASATGSTAYSLSAGGPILAPNLDCMVLTPVCPHTLHARPVVISAQEAVRVRVLDDPGRARVLLDGRRTLALEENGGEVYVGRAKQTAKFVRLHSRNFYDMLRQKLSDWTH